MQLTYLRDPRLPPLDLMIDFSGARPTQPQIELPRLGYWVLAYGEPPELSDPGRPEILGGTRAAHVRLIRLESPDRGRVLREGAVKAIGHSLAATRQRLLEAVVDWPGRALREMLRPASAAAAWPVVHLRTPRRLARLVQLAQLPWALGRNLLRRATQEITREHWALGVIPAPLRQIYQSFDPASIRWLPAPRDGFLADPFGLVLPDGRLVILAEALSWRDGRGRIVAFESRADGTLESFGEVLDCASHASYPQIIKHEGEIFCIPETAQQRRVQLFRADPFPRRWVADAVLLENFAGADATLHFHDGRWWLFTGNHDDQDETKLYLFHAAQLRGPWQPHACNPVKCDLRSARPAGPLFTLEGSLYRPAQDCSATYGGAVVINRVETLTPEDFSEHPVKRLAPAAHGPYPHGLHTLSSAGDITLVDGKRHSVSAAALALRLRELTRRLTRGRRRD